MAIHESGENYLEQILIQQDSRGNARSVDIADAMEVSKPSVSVAMKKLCEEGYIVFDGDRLIYLTESGRSIAEKIYERHVKLTALFVKIGIPEAAAEKDACACPTSILSIRVPTISGVSSCMSVNFLTTRMNCFTLSDVAAGWVP